jgi:transcriptional regulator with XRE-family HTH domain
MDDLVRRRELAEFLRSRRERLTPEDAGLRLGSHRRRTPGLRREEVAELAGIGTAWYTWLEQARDVRPSEQALRRIARALQFDETEKRYYLELALGCVPRSRGEELVPPELETLLHGLAVPAYVKGLRWDVLAFNEAADATFEFSRAADPNVLRTAFHSDMRARLPNWEQYARQQVAMFRADCVGLLKEPLVGELVDELTQSSAEFREYWSEHAVEEMKSGHETYDHPHVGELSLTFTILQSADNPNLRLVVFQPDDEETEERLAQLLARRGRPANA